MRVVFVRHTDLRELDLVEEVQVVPSVRDNLDLIILTRGDVIRPCWDLIRHKESESECVVVFDSSGSLTWQKNIFLLQLEVFLMQHFLVVVYDNPEWLTLAIPSIIPIELGSDRHLHFED